MSEILPSVQKAASEKYASHEEKAADAALQAYMEVHCPSESNAGRRKREVVMQRLQKMVRVWVREVCARQGLSEDIATEAGGKMCISGSYRLGVNDEDGDIDVALLVPQFVSKEDFFSTLQAKLEEVGENVKPVPTAAVPIITFELDGVEIDLQFVQLLRRAITNKGLALVH